MKVFPLLCALLLAIPPAGAAQFSDLWGEHGELWSPDSRLPDFSHAGYHSGEAPIPTLPPGVDITDFGAVGDGRTDCTDAFKKAIQETASGAIEIPEGRYLIRDILWIRKPGIVLRGAGPDRTFLLPTNKLEEVRPNMGKTTGGRPTSKYSWSGGFLWIKGKPDQGLITRITSEARRGEFTFEVADSAKLETGQFVTVEISEQGSKTIPEHFYAGESGDITKLPSRQSVRFISRIQNVQGHTVTLERPLRFDLRKAWKPVLKSFQPTVRECGIENLTIRFPIEDYRGHFTELGMNGIAVEGAVNCWVRNVRIANADSGLYLRGYFCTAENIVITSGRKATKGDTGHHGIDLGQDCLVQDFEIQTSFIHDISLSNYNAGNVVKNGRGVDLSLDHHKKAPVDNLFCNLHSAKAGKSLWRCGGGAQLGRNAGRGNTFWRITGGNRIPYPPERFGPAEMNFVGIHSNEPEIKERGGKWWEVIDPDALEPADLHAAQLTRRLHKKP